MRLTASDIVYSINQLPKDIFYHYINPKTKGKIKIINVILPEGPIIIQRADASKSQIFSDSKNESISTSMIWRIANAISENQPINFDRILGASYNTRSVLESLIAHTPEFYYCYPGRIQMVDINNVKVKHGHKHLLWLPNRPHQLGLIEPVETDVVISEVPTSEAIYESLTIPDGLTSPEIDIDQVRRHAQIQIALMLIGIQLGSKVWIANNDRSIIYNGKRIGEYDGVLPRLQDFKLLSQYEEAIHSALLIDCIWFKNSRLMPAVFEIEHSTGVTSGLSRMKCFKDNFIPIEGTRWVIVSPDEIRGKVFNEANKSQFRDLKIHFFPYSSVEDLYALCQRRKIKGVNEGFLDCFMEPCIAA